MKSKVEIPPSCAVINGVREACIGIRNRPGKTSFSIVVSHKRKDLRHNAGFHDKTEQHARPECGIDTVGVSIAE